MSNSIINNDQKIAKKRRNKLKDQPEENVKVEVPLRDQISKKLMDKVNELGLGLKLTQVWSVGNADRANWLRRQQQVLQDYDEFYESTAEGPFEQASSLHLPITFIVIKTMHARFLQALLGIDPPFQCKPRNEASVERAQNMQELVRYQLNYDMNCRNGAFEALDLWLWHWCASGSGLIKPHWKRKFTRYEDVELVPEQGVPIFDVDNDGNEIMIPQILNKEVAKMKTEMLWEGIQLNFLFNEDVLIIGGQGDPQRADIVIQKEPLTASELLSFADQKIFDEDICREVIKSGKSHAGDDTTGTIKQQRKTNSAEHQLDSVAQLDRYNILECYLEADIDDSGINCDIVVWVHEGTGKVLRATYLHRINKNGKIPIKKIDFIRRPGQDYGMGLAEILHPLQTEIDAMHNMRIDFGLLSTMPFGFYRPTSSVKPEKIQIEPGSLYPLDNPQTDVVFPQLGNRTAFGHQEEAALNTIVERLTGISDLSLGVLSGNQGATRTATGTRALVGELSANLDVFLRRLNIGWKQLLEHCVDLNQQRLPIGFNFRVANDDDTEWWIKINDRSEIRGDFDIEVSPNSSTSNQQIREQRATQILNLTSNPLDMQLGIVSPLERYNAMRDYIKILGCKSASRYARKPEGVPQFMTPEEEANRVLRGIPVQVVPIMDHEGFIAYASHFLQDDNLAGQVDQEAYAALALQLRQHQEILENMKRMQAQQANRQQIIENSGLGVSGNNPGQNPLIGR